MGNKPQKSQREQRTEQGGGACGFLCAVLIIIAIAVNSLSKYTLTLPFIGDFELVYGWDQIGGDVKDYCDQAGVDCTYSKGCDNCLEDDCDTCKISTAGTAFVLLNLVACVLCIFVGLGIFIPALARARSALKFMYAVSSLLLIIAIIWWCFCTKKGAPYDGDDKDYTLEASIIIDIVAAIFLALAVYCVK